MDTRYLVTSTERFGQKELPTQYTLILLPLKTGLPFLKPYLDEQAGRKEKEDAPEHPGR